MRDSQPVPHQLPAFSWPPQPPLATACELLGAQPWPLQAGLALEPVTQSRKGYQRCCSRCCYRIQGHAHALCTEHCQLNCWCMACSIMVCYSQLSLLDTQRQGSMLRHRKSNLGSRNGRMARHNQYRNPGLSGQIYDASARLHICCSDLTCCYHPIVNACFTTYHMPCAQCINQACVVEWLTTWALSDCSLVVCDSSSACWRAARPSSSAWRLWKRRSSSAALLMATTALSSRSRAQALCTASLLQTPQALSSICNACVSPEAMICLTC